MDSFSVFTENFKLASTAHSYNTDQQEMLFVPSYNLVRFGRKSIIHSTTLTWNHLQDKLTEYDLFKFISKKPENITLEILYFCLW